MTKMNASAVSVLILVPLPFANMGEEPMTFTAAIQRVRFWQLVTLFSENVHISV